MTGRSELPDPAFWGGSRVMVTGHTGFKGSWLCVWLRQLGAEVMGVSLPEPVSRPDLWESLQDLNVADVRSDIVGSDWIGRARDFQPEVVLHLAAQSIVSRGYSDPLTTFTTNIGGTARLLDALRAVPSVRTALLVTTDKVYDTNQPLPFSESAALGGLDPYSASKAAMELVVHAWPEPSFALATARAGNVIGGGDWAENRLVPDLVRHWTEGRELLLRRPQSNRPWQHVLEPLRGYLLYAELLSRSSEFPRSLNLGPDVAQCISVETLVAHGAELWPHMMPGSPPPTWGTVSQPGMSETGRLELDSSLARETLPWRNVLDWEGSLHKALRWYADATRGTPPLDLIERDIDEYSLAVEGAQR